MKVVLGSSPQGARESFSFSEVEGSGMIQSDFLEYLDTKWKMQSRDRGGKKQARKQALTQQPTPEKNQGEAAIMVSRDPLLKQEMRKPTQALIQQPSNLWLRADLV